jgi:hypothetical protein
LFSEKTKVTLVSFRASLTSAWVPTTKMPSVEAVTGCGTTAKPTKIAANNQARIFPSLLPAKTPGYETILAGAGKTFQPFLIKSSQISGRELLRTF